LGYDFYEMYFKPTPENVEKQVVLQKILLELAHWVEEHGDACSIAEFCASVTRTANNIKNSNKCRGLELGEFRLVVFVHLLALSGWIKKGYGIVERFYPVEGSGSCKHLEEAWKNCAENDSAEFDLCNYEFAMQLTSQDLDLPHFNAEWVEACLCESYPGRNSNDVLMEGCNIVMIKRWDGPDSPCTRRVKYYNTYSWRDHDAR